MMEAKREFEAKSKDERRDGAINCRRGGGAEIPLRGHCFDDKDDDDDDDDNEEFCGDDEASISILAFPSWPTSGVLVVGALAYMVAFGGVCCGSTGVALGGAVISAVVVASSLVIGEEGFFNSSTPQELTAEAKQTKTLDMPSTPNDTSSSSSPPPGDVSKE